MQNDSESPGESAGLRRSISYPPATNMREVVFEQFSPRGLHVRMRITDVQPSSPTDDSTFVLGPPPLPRHAPPPTPYTAPEQSPAVSPAATASPAQERRHSPSGLKMQHSGRPPATPKLKAALSRMGGKEGGRPVFDIEVRADTEAQMAAGLVPADRRIAGNGADEVTAVPQLLKQLKHTFITSMASNACQHLDIALQGVHPCVLPSSHTVIKIECLYSQT